MLMLRTVDPERKSYGGFQWKGVGEITTAPDWNPNPGVKITTTPFVLDFTNEL